jgi:hypothetical protein
MASQRSDSIGFQAIWYHWIVVQTFVGLGPYRYLSKQDEYQTTSKETMITSMCYRFEPGK